MNYEVPDFQSDIPEHLLTNASPQDKYIMENLSILGQKSNWLTETQKTQFERLDGLVTSSEEIRIQTTKTNGKVAVLQEKAVEAEKVVQFYNTAKGFATNKMFILGSAFSFLVFFSYGVPWLILHGKDFIPVIITSMFGG